MTNESGTESNAGASTPPLMTREEAEQLRAELEAERIGAERAAAEAQLAARLTHGKQKRRGRIIELLVGFTAPPIIGIVILALLFAGSGSDAILDSPAATSTALIVGALLLLVPPIVYAFSPERYAWHQADVERRLRELAREIH